MSKQPTTTANKTLVASTRKYSLMYYYGFWVPCATLFEENDLRAVFDADGIEMIAADRLQYALFCGNRLVKMYPAPSNPAVTITTD